uniref:Uncharacterized protein n=1 Tax=Ciona intestinalis TaxID=7719 RepID=H2Y2R3_CIOIN
MYDSSSDEDETTEMGGVKCVVSSHKRKILAPMRGVDSDEEELSLKMKKKDVAPKVGLFAKLPAPRNTIGSGKQTERPLIPHVFRRKEEIKKKAPVEVKTIKKTAIQSYLIFRLKLQQLLWRSNKLTNMMNKLQQQFLKISKKTKVF